MNRLFYKISAFLITILTLSSCSLSHPTPELVSKYEAQDFKLAKASHEDFTRKYINDDYDYKYGHYEGEKEGYFLNIYYQDKLVYNFEHYDSVYIEYPRVIDNKLYYKFNATNYLNKRYYEAIKCFDLENTYTLYEEDEYIIDEYINFGDTITFFKSDRRENGPESIVSLDYEGNIINEFPFDEDLGVCHNIYLSDSGVILECKTYKDKSFYLYSLDGTNIKNLLTVDKDIIIKNLTYTNDELYLLGYLETYTDFNITNLKIYEYKNNNLKELFNIDLPDDYDYSLSLIEQYKDNIYIDFNVSLKLAPKTTYNREVILKCDLNDCTIKSLYKNKSSLYVTFYNNGHIYLGSYKNKALVNNEQSGKFYDIDLDSLK